MKSLSRMVSLAVALGLVALSSASGAGMATCRYVCRNSTTGQITFLTTFTSESSCCSGDGLTCPAGTTFDGPISWNGIVIKAC